ncbi:hypothetical protein LWI28_007261 [Acer negundo]|uniref:Uncharacterized protein n=1 Tax=Acer negundo TaxID=4023 RepID=A0AAD5IDT3_ACENE|nr:hypothetical protein LWI28_007261 [Acer negundo]
MEDCLDLIQNSWAGFDSANKLDHLTGNLSRCVVHLKKWNLDNKKALQAGVRRKKTEMALVFVACDNVDWKRRNQLPFSNTVLPVDGIVEWFVNFLADFRGARHVEQSAKSVPERVARKELGVCKVGFCVRRIVVHETMEVEKKQSKGGFLNLFDWNGKSQKKIFSNNPEFDDESKKGKENIGKIA